MQIFLAKYSYINHCGDEDSEGGENAVQAGSGCWPHICCPHVDQYGKVEFGLEGIQLVLLLDCQDI